MRCPYCSCEETQVKDSRPTEENAAIRRRRVCPDCGGRCRVIAVVNSPVGVQSILNHLGLCSEPPRLMSAARQLEIEWS